MNKVEVQNLIIEVGRMCNRKCEHCLRGPMEDVTIKFEYAKHILDQTQWIGSITFTGGEPTLYAKEISQIIDYIIEKDIVVGDFYIASNGEIYSHELMCSLIKLYAHIIKQNGIAECTAFEVSNDQFHNPSENVVNQLKAFTFFSQRQNIPWRGIIAEGNAASFGHRFLDYDQKFEVNENDNDYCYEMVYLNAEGKLLADCDFSFETQRDIDFPQYNQFSLHEIAQNPKYSKKI